MVDGTHDMELRVKPGITLPSPTLTSGSRVRKYPLDTMQVGDMIFIPDRLPALISSYVHRVGRKLSAETGVTLKFATQKAVMRQDLQTGVWEPCKVGAPGCRHGTAVRRIV